MRSGKAAASKSDTPAKETYKPLTPRPRLFLALSVIFALWVLFLIVLFFTTVYSRWHVLHPPLPTAR